MNANRTAQFALVLSAITLAVVLVIAARPEPQQVDNTASLRFAIVNVRDDIAELRRLLEADPGSSPDAQLVERLDRIEASVASVGAKVQAICSAIQSSPFAPSGFACP